MLSMDHERLEEVVGGSIMCCIGRPIAWSDDVPLVVIDS